MQSDLVRYGSNWCVLTSSRLLSFRLLLDQKGCMEQVKISGQVQQSGVAQLNFGLFFLNQTKWEGCQMVILLDRRGSWANGRLLPAAAQRGRGGAGAAAWYSEHMSGLVWLVGSRVSQLVRGLGLLQGCKLGCGTYNIRCLSVCLLYKPFYISLPDLVWDPSPSLPGPERRAP